MMLLLCLFAVNVSALAELPVGTPAAVPAPGNRDGVVTASDGRDFLVVWVDDRRVGGRGLPALLAARVTPDGTVLDPFGIVLTRDMAGSPNVVYAGGAYSVMWWRDSQLFAARIAADGTIVTAPCRRRSGPAPSSPYRHSTRRSTTNRSRSRARRAESPWPTAGRPGNRSSAASIVCSCSCFCDARGQCGSPFDLDP